MSYRWVICGVMAICLIELSACASTTNSEFTCPAPNTGMCKPVHEVDRLVDSGALGDKLITTTLALPPPTPAVPDTWHNATTPYDATVMPGQPLRLHDKVMAIWIAPYEDNRGVYHDASTVYTVVSPSHWSTHPVKAVKEH